MGNIYFRMLKYFAYKNTYFIIGCLLLILLMVLLSRYYFSSVEGFTYTITTANHDPKISCGTNWRPVNTNAGFNFRNSNYTSIYMLNTSLDDITQLFDNYANTIFNFDCSNVLYSTRQNNTFSKYMYNNSVIKFRPILLTQRSYIGVFYECLKKMVNDAKPLITFNYYSREPNKGWLQLTMTNKNNSNNKFVFSMNLKPGGVTLINNVIKQSLRIPHATYNTTTKVTGISLNVLPNTQTCNIRIFKQVGNNTEVDSLKSKPLPKIDNSILNQLGNRISSMYNKTDPSSSVANFNLVGGSNRIRYIYGTVEYGGNQDNVIVQIPNFRT